MKKEVKEIVDAFKGQALNYVVILKQIENKNVTESKLDLSSAVDKNEKYRRAIIVSMGVDCPKGFANVGDEVLFDETKSSALTLDAIEYKTLFFADLTMVF